MKLNVPWSPSALLRAPAWRFGWRAGGPVVGGAWRALTQRGAFAWAGFAVGLLGVSWLHAHTLGALWADEDPVSSMQGQLATLQAQLRKAQTPSDAPQGPSAFLSQLPTRDRQAVIWLQFSQLLAQHAVQLQSLRPVPDGAIAPLSSQAVAVRLHAQFDDWTAVWSALNAHGPVWSIDRLRITPQGQGVDIEAVLRVWFGDGLDVGLRSDLGRFAPDHPQGELHETSRLNRGRTAVFLQESEPLNATLTAPRGDQSQDLQAKAGVSNETTRPAPTPLEGGANGSADPAHWPWAQIRLLGVWHQAQDAHALFAAGPHWAHARVGQQIGAEGHQVETIFPHEVHLRTSQGGLQVLGLDKALP